MTTYTPTAADIAWTQRTLSFINEGGLWIAPGMRAIFTVSHATKTLTLQDDWQLAEAEGLDRVRCVLAAMGWKLETPNRN